MVALGTIYSFALFSSLSNLNQISYRDPQSGQGNLPERKTFFSCLLPCIIQPLTTPPSTGPGRTELNQMLTQPYLLECKIAGLWAGSWE